MMQPTSAGNGEAPGDGYAVRVSQGSGGWAVHIVHPGGELRFTRSCSNETEARTFASTVEQHLYWLSPSKFAEYYRLQEGEA